MDDTNTKVLVYTFNGYEQGDEGNIHRMVVRIPQGVKSEEIVGLYHRLGAKDAHIEQTREVKPCGGYREFGSR